MKWLGKTMSTLKTSSIGAIFTSAYHTKQLNPWLNSLARRVVSYNYSHLSACPEGMDPLKFTRELVDIWQASEVSHSKSSLENIQHQYLPQLVVNLCSHCLMVKSVSCCCVHWSQLFSNQVTIYFLSSPFSSKTILKNIFHKVFNVMATMCSDNG